jgi:hypothetical protein
MHRIKENMVKGTFLLNDKEYDSASLTDTGREIYRNMIFTKRRLREMENNLAVLKRAKNSYIDAIKHEAIKKSTGIDLKSIFEDG